MFPSKSKPCRRRQQNNKNLITSSLAKIILTVDNNINIRVSCKISFFCVIYMYKYKSAIYMKINICLYRLIYTKRMFKPPRVSCRNGKTSHIT